MPNIYTVTQINRYIKNMFMQDYLLQSVSIQGEVSNCKYHSSGHIYFTLKDREGTLSCIMFSGYRRELSFTLEEGQQVVVQGAIAVYERDGKYQLYARKIEKSGEGVLFEQFQKLKSRLMEMGLFESMYKQPIPHYIRTLGVVTASTGAAVRDIIQIARRRNPFVQILLYPAIVQGEAAVPSIVKGIKALEKQGVDVMIVGRGGGSLEDLWAFNSEEVAQAVFDCSIPVISAVGHETDTTIIDFVADLRAPTPSAAAELAVYDVFACLERLKEKEESLGQTMAGKLRLEKIRLERQTLRLRHLSPLNQIRDKRYRCIRSEELLRENMEKLLQRKRSRLELQIERLQGLSPLEKLRQGYSYTVNGAGKNIRDISQVKPDEELTIYVTNGQITAKVKEIQGGKEERKSVDS
ncbi:MAG: exodeoxyribonuclease VII large subunit [Lachnospiraceae bacterium]